MFNDPIVILVVVGAIGGLVRSLLGFSQQADANETFSAKKLIASILRAAIAGSFLVYSTLEIPADPSAKFYLSAFFLSIGAEVALKELYGAAKNSISS